MNEARYPEIAAIEQARTAIAGATRQTPVDPSPSLSELTGSPVWLKLEHQQVTGSFKVRGATNAVSRLTDEQREKEVKWGGVEA